MFWPPGPQIPQPHMHWDYHRPPHNPQWRRPIGPRATFHGHHQHFNHPGPPFQTGKDNYWCETCDRGFASEDILNNHKQQHQKCNIDGCQFIAHPKVITKHIQMQHSTGLYKKIANLKNPEEIAKWREERRKRYPTKSNIEKRAAELKEKIERGEKMGLQKNRGYHNKTNFEQDILPGHGMKRKFNSRNENQQKTKFRRSNPVNKHINNAPPKTKPPPILMEDNRLKPFAGISNLQMDSDNENDNEFEELSGLIEDEDDSVELKSEKVAEVPENTKPIVCGALSSLMCDYGSSEEEDNSEVVRPVTKDTKQLAKDSPNSNLIHKLNQMYSVSAKGMNRKDDGKENEQSNDLKNTINNQPECKENTNKTTINETPVDFLNYSVQNFDYQNNRQAENTEVDTITCIPVKNDEIHDNEVEVKKSSVQETINDSDSGPEEVKAEVRKENPSVPDQSRTIENRKPAFKGRMLVNQRRKPKLPSTLLQKLLHREMQQERNIILQCIRYIRNNNYFDKKE